MKVFFVDHFDSFLFNLVDEFARRGCATACSRSNVPPDLLEERIRESGADLVVLSPGPGHPSDLPGTRALVRTLAGEVPLFGVCLGHQCIVEAFGGTVGRVPSGAVHGSASPIRHSGQGIYEGLPDPLRAGRYHSLAALSVPAPLEIDATCGDVVMGIRHRELPVYGVQFHPESILTPVGGRMVDNLIALCAKPEEACRA